MKIKIIALTAAFLMLFTLNTFIPVMADEETSSTPAITLESKSVVAQVDKTISVDVTISNNPGVVTMTIPVTWDTEVLELIGVTNTYDILTETEECTGWLGTSDYTYAQTNGVYYLAWDNDLAVENFTGNGRLCTMEFKVISEFESTTVNVNMEADEKILPIANVMNFDMNDLQSTFTYTAATLTAGGSEVMVGDIGGDGKLNRADLILLSRYFAGNADISEINVEAADVNHDGKFNRADLIKMKKYFAGSIDSLE